MLVFWGLFGGAVQWGGSSNGNTYSGIYCGYGCLGEQGAWNSKKKERPNGTLSKLQK